MQHLATWRSNVLQASVGRSVYQKVATSFCDPRPSTFRLLHLFEGHHGVLKRLSLLGVGGCSPRSACQQKPYDRNFGFAIYEDLVRFAKAKNQLSENLV